MYFDSSKRWDSILISLASHEKPIYIYCNSGYFTDMFCSVRGKGQYQVVVFEIVLVFHQLQRSLCKIDGNFFNLWCSQNRATWRDCSPSAEMDMLTVYWKHLILSLNFHMSTVKWRLERRLLSKTWSCIWFLPSSFRAASHW